MSDTSATPFSIGVTYWPRRTGQIWWRAFDRGEAHDELAHVASLGCDTVRFCLRWEDFQPGAQRINSGAFEALEQALEAAQSANLRVVAGLFPVAIGGVLNVPQWANGANPLDELRRATRITGMGYEIRAPEGPPLLYDDRYHPNQAGDLFVDSAILDAQRFLVREIVGYFGSHPGMWAWQLGEGLERVRRPASAAAVYEWYGTMVEAVREQRSNARVLGVVSPLALETPAGPRPEAIADTCDLVGIAADPPLPPNHERANHGGWVTLLHALTASLGRRPAIVTSFALPTAPDERPDWIADTAFGRPSRAFLGDTEQQSRFVGDVLDRLQRAGALGAWLASYADYPTELWRRPPLDKVTRERTLGIVDAAGREKPVAEALRSFAAQKRVVADVAPPLDADSERYWREPREQLRALWSEWQDQL